MSVARRSYGFDPHFKTADTLVSESTFSAGSTPEEILAFLRREKVSGTLTININKGGATRSLFRQSQPVDVDS
jgi:hypothetical protein